MSNQHTLADRLSRAFCEFRTIPVIAAELPQTEAAAESIQDALIQTLGPVAAWKLGATQDRGLRKMGLGRFFFGALPADRVSLEGEKIAGPWADTIGVECEYAFRFDRAIAPGDPIDLSSVKAAIGGVHPAFEIPGTRYEGKLGEYGGLANIADDGLAGSLVVGDVCATGDLARFAHNPVKLVVGGEIVAEGIAAGRIDLFPYELLTQFVQRAVARGHSISANQFVVPGSCTGYMKVPLGVPVIGDFGELGKVEAVFQTKQ